MGGPIGKGGLIFNLVKMVVSALLRELEWKSSQGTKKKKDLPTHE